MSRYWRRRTGKGSDKVGIAENYFGRRDVVSFNVIIEHRAFS
jgi:hypothetical protein